MQKKYATGRPDQKDLNENLAATQGLAHMIVECNRLFEVEEPADEMMQDFEGWVQYFHPPTFLCVYPCCQSHIMILCTHQIPHEMVTQSRNSYVEADLHASTLGELCKQLEDDDGTYPTHMEGRLQNLLKEAREKSKYWVSCSSSDNTELYYKKVGFLFFLDSQVFG